MHFVQDRMQETTDANKFFVHCIHQIFANIISSCICVRAFKQKSLLLHCNAVGQPFSAFLRTTFYSLFLVLLLCTATLAQTNGHIFAIYMNWIGNHWQREIAFCRAFRTKMPSQYALYRPHVFAPNISKIRRAQCEFLMLISVSVRVHNTTSTRFVWVYMCCARNCNADKSIRLKYWYHTTFFLLSIFYVAVFALLLIQEKDPAFFGLLCNAFFTRSSRNW